MDATGYRDGLDWPIVARLDGAGDELPPVNLDQKVTLGGTVGTIGALLLILAAIWIAWQEAD
jgi:hypothetical protein